MHPSPHPLSLPEIASWQFPELASADWLLEGPGERLAFSLRWEDLNNPEKCAAFMNAACSRTLRLYRDWYEALDVGRLQPTGQPGQVRATILTGVRSAGEGSGYRRGRRFRLLPGQTEWVEALTSFVTAASKAFSLPDRVQ